jgi:hypothetical protein
MNAVPTQVRDNIATAARRYGLTDANVKIMLEDARKAPVSTSRAYAAIVRSLVKR